MSHSRFCMTVFKLRLVLCVGILSGFSFATQPSAEPLEAAVRNAIEEHPSVEAALASFEAAREVKREERSGYFPELSVTGSGGRIFGDNSTSRGLSVTRGVGYSYLFEGSFTARQMLFDGFETRNRVEAAKARSSSADLSVADVREGLALQTTQAYIEVMRAQEGLVALQQHEAKIRDYLERIKTGLDDGVSDEAEYQQAIDVSISLDGLIADYLGQLQTAQAQYLEATGHMPQGDMSLPSPDISLIPQDSEQAVLYAFENHPGVLAAKYDAESAAHDISSEKSLLAPDVDGELFYLKSDRDEILGGEVEDARAILRMNWNFETGGAHFARVKRRRAEHKSALSRIKELERQIETGIRVAYSDLSVAQSQLEIQKKREALNIQLLETYNVQFEGARISLLQLMQADNQRLNATLQTSSAEYRALGAQYAVLASIGQLQRSLDLGGSDGYQAGVDIAAVPAEGLIDEAN